MDNERPTVIANLKLGDSEQQSFASGADGYADALALGGEPVEMVIEFADSNPVIEKTFNEISIDPDAGRIEIKLTAEDRRLIRDAAMAGGMVSFKITPSPSSSPDTLPEL